MQFYLLINEISITGLNKIPWNKNFNQIFNHFSHRILMQDFHRILKIIFDIVSLYDLMQFHNSIL